MQILYRHWYGTPYYSQRLLDGEPVEIRYLIMHDTEGPRDAALAWWSSPDNPYQSSAHDLIDVAGIVWCCVPYALAAHHCGGGHIPGWNTLNQATGRYEPNANLPSIGVELEYPAAPASPPWPRAQLDAAVVHVRDLVQRYRIPRANVLRHAEVDPRNRSDPRNFDWAGFLDRVYGGIVQEAAWNARGIPWNEEAALARYAREHGLGNPETPEFDFELAGAACRGQGFSRAIVYARVGAWGEIWEVSW